jgi:hypothetical protein
MIVEYGWVTIPPDATKRQRKILFGEGIANALSDMLAWRHQNK